MSMDSVRAYLQLVSGATEVTRARATEIAHGLLTMASRATPADVATQVSALAEDLVATASANREMLLSIVQGEVRQAMEGSAAMARLADIDIVRGLLGQLRQEVDGLREQVVRGGGAAMATVASIQASTPSAARTRPYRSAGSMPTQVATPEFGAEADRPTAALPARIATPEFGVQPERSRPVRVRKSTAGAASAASTTKTSSATKSAPVKKAAPATKSAPVKKAAPAKKAAPTKKAAPAAAKKAAPAAKVARATKAAPVKKAAPATKVAPEKKSSPATKAAPTTEATASTSGDA